MKNKCVILSELRRKLFKSCYGEDCIKKMSSWSASRDRIHNDSVGSFGFYRMRVATVAATPIQTIRCLAVPSKSPAAVRNQAVR